MATEVPLAKSIRPSGRRWSPWDIADSCVVDTARIRPLTVGHGDSDGRARRIGGRIARKGDRARMKPIAGETRRMPPFGSPKREERHDQTRQNTGGNARSHVDPPHGGTDLHVVLRGRSRDKSALRLRGYMDGPASRASILSAARGEGRLNGFPGALAVVLRHRIAGRRRRVSDTAPTGLSDARFVVQPAYSLGPHSVSPLRRLAGGRAPSDPRNANGAP